MAAGNSRAPHVSVVIPVYNDAEWIGETLDSVLKQTLPAEQMEVIVVNDGSTDDSRRIAQEKLGGADVASTVLSIKNSGPSRARNVGWREAQAPWIQFLDADDCLHERKLSRHLEATEDIPGLGAQRRFVEGDPAPNAADRGRHREGRTVDPGLYPAR